MYKCSRMYHLGAINAAIIERRARKLHVLAAGRPPSAVDVVAGGKEIAIKTLATSGSGGKECLWKLNVPNLLHSLLAFLELRTFCSVSLHPVSPELAPASAARPPNVEHTSSSFTKREFSATIIIRAIRERIPSICRQRAEENRCPRRAQRSSVKTDRAPSGGRNASPFCDAGECSSSAAIAFRAAL